MAASSSRRQQWRSWTGLNSLHAAGGSIVTPNLAAIAASVSKLGMPPAPVASNSANIWSRPQLGVHRTSRHAGWSLASSLAAPIVVQWKWQSLKAMGIDKYAGLTRRKRTVRNSVVREDREALSIPYRWKKPRKIFVNSMSDLFHEKVSDEFILGVWKVMRETPHHNYQILTKRPERVATLVASRMDDILPNVWLGISIENADVARRVGYLRQARPRPSASSPLNL
jgi:hypothetical protein